MAVSTNLGLYLPTREDYISVSRDLSNNYEIIDKSAGMLEKGIAIVVDGDTAPRAITSGQYLFIKNHSSLATGGYHATANIANGATITSSNVSVDSAGVVNAAYASLSSDISALNSKLIPSNVSYSFTNNVTGSANDTSIRKSGNILIVNIVFTANGTTTLSVATFSGVSIMPTQYCLFREVSSDITKRGYVNNNELTIVDAEANKQYIGIATFAIT